MVAKGGFSSRAFGRRRGDDGGSFKVDALSDTVEVANVHRIF